jgi:hypothetical protein
MDHQYSRSRIQQALKARFPSSKLTVVGCKRLFHCCMTDTWQRNHRFFSLFDSNYEISPNEFSEFKEKRILNHLPQLSAPRSHQRRHDAAKRIGRVIIFADCQSGLGLC